MNDLLQSPARRSTESSGRDTGAAHSRFRADSQLEECGYGSPDCPAGVPVPGGIPRARAVHPGVERGRRRRRVVHRPSKVCRHRLPRPRGHLAIACRHRSAPGPPPSRGGWLTASPGTRLPARARAAHERTCQVRSLRSSPIRRAPSSSRRCRQGPYNLMVEKSTYLTGRYPEANRIDPGADEAAPACATVRSSKTDRSDVSRSAPSSGRVLDAHGDPVDFAQVRGPASAARRTRHERWPGADQRPRRIPRAAAAARPLSRAGAAADESELPGPESVA